MNKHCCFFVSYSVSGRLGTFHRSDVLVPIAEINAPEDVAILVNEVAQMTGLPHADIGLVNWKRLPGGDVAHGTGRGGK